MREALGLQESEGFFCYLVSFLGRCNGFSNRRRATSPLSVIRQLKCRDAACRVTGTSFSSLAFPRQKRGTPRPYMPLNSNRIAFAFQLHSLCALTALLLRPNYIASALQLHCFRVPTALLLASNCIAFRLQLHCFWGSTALLLGSNCNAFGGQLHCFWDLDANVGFDVWPGIVVLELEVFVLEVEE